MVEKYFIVMPEHKFNSSYFAFKIAEIIDSKKRLPAKSDGHY